MGSGTKSVAANLDDGHARGAFSTSSTNIWMGYEASVHYDGWMGFAGTDIPAGSVVDSLTMGMIASDPNTSTPTYRIYGVLGTTVPANQGAYDALTKTSSYVAWNPGSWVLGNEYVTPDLSAPATEIVQWAGWSSGLKMIFVIVDYSGTSGQARYPASYNHSTYAPPHIDYTWHSPVPDMYIDVGGVWKAATGVYVNVGGVWKTVETAYVNVGGVWKEV